MQQMVNDMKDGVDRMRDNLGEIMCDMHEIKDDVDKIKDDVGELKCLCSFTCIISVVETEPSPQGTRLNRTFENGFLRQTRPQITTSRARLAMRERLRGFFKAKNSRTGRRSDLFYGSMENVSSSHLLLPMTL